MKHISLLLALSLLMLGLGACGQSGPLYLPPPPSKTPSQLQGPGPKAAPPQTPGASLNQQPDNSALFNGASTSSDDYQGNDSDN